MELAVIILLLFERCTLLRVNFYFIIIFIYKGWIKILGSI